MTLEALSNLNDSVIQYSELSFLMGHRTFSQGAELLLARFIFRSDINHHLHLIYHLHIGHICLKRDYRIFQEGILFVYSIYELVP